MHRDSYSTACTHVELGADLHCLPAAIGKLKLTLMCVCCKTTGGETSLLTSNHRPPPKDP